MLIFYWSEQTQHWLRDSLQLSWPHVFTLSIIRVGPALDKSWLGYDISHLHPPPPTPPPRVVSVLTACPHAAHCHTVTQQLSDFYKNWNPSHSHKMWHTATLCSGMRNFQSYLHVIDHLLEQSSQGSALSANIKILIKQIEGWNHQ